MVDELVREGCRRRRLVGVICEWQGLRGGGGVCWPKVLACGGLYSTDCVKKVASTDMCGLQERQIAEEDKLLRVGRGRHVHEPGHQGFPHSLNMRVFS